MKTRHAKHLLNLSPNESIFGIVGRMELLLDYFAQYKQYSSLIPFLNTYYIITKTVALRLSEPRYFRNPAALQKLDVYFASLYFKPLAIYLNTGTAPEPWKTYFRYCSQAKGSAFLQMMLGINAHINGDLTKTVMDTKYKADKDYELINEILREKIPDVMSFLAFHEGDALGATALMFRQLVEKEFETVIVKWRSLAWDNAQSMRRRPLPYRGIHNQTEQIAQQLIEIFKHRYEIKKLPHNFAELQALHIKI